MNIDVVTTKDGFLSLRDEWERILKQNNDNNFYLSFHWFNFLVCLSELEDSNLFIIHMKKQENTVAIIPCFIKEKKLRFFSVRSLELIGNIYSPFRGCIVERGNEKKVGEILVDYLLNNCSQHWEIIDFQDLSRNDRFITRLMWSFSDTRGITCRVRDEFRNVVTDFSETGGANNYFLRRSKNLRQSIRTSINKMNRYGTFDIVLLRDEGQDVHAAMNHYYQIYDSSWKMPEAYPEFHKKLAEYLLQRKWLRLFILYYRPSQNKANNSEVTHPLSSYESSIRDRRDIPDILGDYIPLAANFFVFYAGRAYFLKSAYRDHYSQVSPGSALFWFSLKYLLEVDGAEIIDFQKGAESYKLRWGEISDTRFHCQAANPRSYRSRFEFWIEHNIIPHIRKLKKRLLVPR